MKPKVWTTTPPIATGYYWWRTRKGGKFYTMVSVTWMLEGSEKILWASSASASCAVREMAGEWQGPLSPAGVVQ